MAWRHRRPQTTCFAATSALSLCLLSSLQAQTPADSIRLVSRTWLPPAGMEASLAAELARAATRARVHVIVQMVRHPSVAERSALSAGNGLVLLDPLPGTAYFASMPRAFRGATPLPGLVRWVGSIRAADRLSLDLRPPRLDSSVIRGTRDARIIARFFLDVPSAAQEARLRAYAGSDLQRVELLNGWTLVIPADSIEALATEDGVQWLSALPGQPVTDNDAVRGPGGVNADAVSFATSYGLTGSGVTVASWDNASPSLHHADLIGRVTIADGGIPIWTRNTVHVESGPTAAAFDAGEAIYSDWDDSETVTAGDMRLTAVSGFLAYSAVNAPDSDIGTALVRFMDTELYVDSNDNFIYTSGEPIYRDYDVSGTVSLGDTRVDGPATAAGTRLSPLSADPHGHATMVVGTLAGDGSWSDDSGEYSGRWAGVAPRAQVRAYHICPFTGCIGPWLSSISEDNRDAAANASRIGANAWTARGTHCHQLIDTKVCYDELSEIYDGIASGRRRDGTSLGPNRLLPIGSSGNRGYEELHSDDGAITGAFDAGEAIYRDIDGNGMVSVVDELLAGLARGIDTPLVPFAVDELHAETVSDSGSYETNEGIYRDTDGSQKISSGDIRLAVPGYAVGSSVAGGSPDASAAAIALLRPFLRWGSVGTGNAAKNGLQVGAFAADATTLPAFSGRGPTREGRIKPDVVAAGARATGDGRIRSPWPRNGYGYAAGTSIATGAAAGAAALLAESYASSCVTGGASPEVLRALLVHGADDVVIASRGAFTGPDYATGFGRLNVKQSIDLIPHHLLGEIGVSPTATLTTGRGPLRVTLLWNDPPSVPNATPGPHGILNNDLDLVLVAPNGTRYLPWTLDHTDPDTPAERGVVLSGAPIPLSMRDRSNTLEQVVIDDAMAGTWSIEVSAAQLALGPQGYVLVSEALSPSRSPCASAPGADVWMRDNDADTGAEPSSGVLWISPDVWNRVSMGTGSVHEDPEFGQTNYLHARIRNRSGIVAQATTVEFWVADASTGLSWPASFKLVGRLGVPRLAAGEERIIGPLAWLPPNPAPSSHHCVYVRVLSSQDQPGFVEVANVGTNARIRNSRVYRNLNIVDLHSSRTVSFVVRNLSAVATVIDLGMSVPASYLASGEVQLTLAPELERAWSARGRVASLGIEGPTTAPRTARTGTSAPTSATRPRPDGENGYRITGSDVLLPGLPLQHGQAARVTLTFSSSQTAPSSHVIDVFQRAAGVVEGGIRYVVRTGVP